MNSNPTLSFVWFGITEIAGRWKDGLYLAMKHLEREYTVYYQEPTEDIMPVMTAFGINEEIMKPMIADILYDGIHHGTCASWKRQNLLAEALGDKGLVVGRYQETDPTLHRKYKKSIMRYSIIIPIYDPEGKNEYLTSRCILSILKNSMEYDYEIIPIQHTDLNYSTAVNKGIKRATGDFLIFMSNDVEVLDSKWLKKYTEKDCITSFTQYPFYITGELVPDASCWGMSREVFNKVGYLDTRFKDGYGYEDSDYWMRCQKLGIPFVNVHADLVHRENQTFTAYFSEEKAAMTKKNGELFLAKWNKILSKSV